jgi:hypothetical protein
MAINYNIQAGVVDGNTDLTKWIEENYGKLERFPRKASGGCLSQL